MQQSEHSYLLDALDHLRFSAKIESLGRQTADEGTQAIEEKLDKLILAAESGQFDPFQVGNFLDSAVMEIWQKDRRIEPVMYLYEKYYSVRKWEDGPTLGVGFTTSMAKIVSETPQKRDKDTLIGSTIRFLIRANQDVGFRVMEVAHFAKELYFNGLENEGREIAGYISKNEKVAMSIEPGIREIIEEIPPAIS